MIKKNLWQIIGTLIGITGIFLSIFLYQKTIRERDPVLIIDPVRTEILDSEKLVNSPIVVKTPDGSPVNADVTSVNFYFWNKGAESIKKEHILKNLSLVIGDPSAKIIDKKLLKVSRDVSKIDLYSSKETSNRINISFNILEKYDGLSGQIIYEGNPEADIYIEGIIEGVEQVSNFALSDSALIERSIINVFIGIGIAILSIIVFMIMMIITPQPDYDPPDVRKSEDYKNNLEFKEAFERYDAIKKKIDSERYKNYSKTEETKKGRWKIILSLVLVSIFLIAFIVSYFITKNDVIDNPRDYIPIKIMLTN